MSAIDDFLNGRNWSLFAHTKVGGAPVIYTKAEWVGDDIPWMEAKAELAALRDQPDKIIRYLINEGLLKTDDLPDEHTFDAVVGAVAALRAELDAKTKAVEEAVKSVSVLKIMLSEEGEYSICRSDHKTMELGEVLSVGGVLERISKAMDALTVHPANTATIEEG